jgi:Fe-S cluster assembly protein SufD
MTDGAYLRLAPGVTVKGPIQLLFIASEAALAIQPRNLFIAGEGSSAAIVEHHVAVDESGYLTNTVSDIVVGAGASIEHHKLQEESPKAFHIATVNVAQAANSRFVSGSFALGGRLARTGITVSLQAEGASCTLDGLYVTDGRQHVDHHTRVDHRQARCTSRELYKGVLNGASRAVFSGRVVVHPDAQGSDAVQTNHNLLLSENAEIDTKPQLEIWADDVKCSHGATVGQLDEAQVFYLRSRGIDEAAARAMLTRAFAMEIIERVQVHALQGRLDELLQAKLPRQ